MTQALQTKETGEDGASFLTFCCHLQRVLAEIQVSTHPDTKKRGFLFLRSGCNASCCE
ncbi:hypothetical protein QUB70_18880 [Microcoleus sp. A003_D6]